MKTQTKQSREPKEYFGYIVYPDAKIHSKYNWRGVLMREMKNSKDSHGYKAVRLTINEKRKFILVHRLMAQLFLEPRPSLKHEVRHIDGNKLNNNISNLSWGTRKENAEDREKHGRTSRGIKHSLAIKKGFLNAK